MPPPFRQYAWRAPILKGKRPKPAFQPFKMKEGNDFCFTDKVIALVELCIQKFWWKFLQGYGILIPKSIRGGLS